jgi:ubiquinone/menaquinone biosynthesis C-methylase UbiE
MFAYDELTKRVPEPEEIMSGSEALNYFKAKSKKKKGVKWYDLVIQDIYSRTSFKQGSILDVGCGSGGLLRNFQKDNSKLNLTGIDASKTLLDAARKISNLNLQYSLAENMKFKSGSFDLVVCQDTFHHFKKPLQVLNEMYRVAKEGGFIYITDLRRDAEKNLIENATSNILKGSISHLIFYLQSVKASYIASEIEELITKSNIKNYKIINGKYNSSIKKIINSIKYQEQKKDKDRLFRERWTIVIKK